MTALKDTVVLLVDDEPEIRELLREELSPQVSKVLEAGSGNAAFELYQNEKVDIVISDFRMPNGSGLELLKKIQARGGKSPVMIFCSGLASDITKEESIILGNHPIIAKPFDIDALIAKLKELVVKQ